MPRTTKAAKALCYACVAVAVALFAGKLLGLPVAVMIVYGSSMEPTLKPLDLAIGVSPSMAGGVEKGDIVVWCLPEDKLKTSCVIHRVVEIRRGEEGYIVITKGDNVEQLDPPVPSSRVSYVVVEVVPRTYVFAVLAAAGAAASYYYIYLPYSVQRRRVIMAPGTLALIMIIVYVVFNLAYIGSSMLDATPTMINAPSVYGEKVSFNLSSGVVNISLKYTPILTLRGSPSCMVVRPTAAEALVEEAYADGGNASIVVRIPGDVFRELWELDSNRTRSWSLPPPPARVSTTIFLRCIISFNYGVLNSTYPLSFNWREPEVKPYNGSAVVLENDNPVPINGSIEVYSHRRGIIYRESVELEPFTHYIVGLPVSWSNDIIDVRFYYVFLGHPRGVKVTIHV